MRAVIGWHEGVLAGLLLAGMFVAASKEPAFVAWGTQFDIATHAFELGLIALPMTLIIIAGGIDLSVGSTMALASVTFGMLTHAGASVWMASGAAIAVGAAAGALNGLFVAKLRVHPLLVTLATFAAYRGLAEGISQGRAMSGFPSWFVDLSTKNVFGVPLLDAVLAIAAVVTGIAAAWSVWGAWVYAIGGNERAAEYCGVPVARVKFGLFTLSGVVAAAAAIAFAARRNTAKADVGTSLEMEAITAVVLGGTSIFGGRGTIAGTVLGVLIVHELREFVSWHWESDEIILVVIGGVLIGSVVLGSVATRPKR